MSEAQDLIDEFNMWIERGTMPRMTAYCNSRKPSLLRKTDGLRNCILQETK